MGVERCALGLGGGCHVRRRETTGIGEDCGVGWGGGRELFATIPETLD